MEKPGSILSLLASIILCFITGCSVSNSQPTKIGSAAPLVQLYSIDGQQFSLDEYQGKQVVLLFWAQWCTKSRSFIADLADGAEALKRRGVSVLAVDIDKQERLDSLNAMITEQGLTSFDHAFSGNDVYDQAFIAFGAGEVPTVYVLDKSHRIVAQGNSFDTVSEYFKLD